MAQQTVTKPMALDETLQATNSVLEDIRDAIGASSLIGDTDISEIADGTLTGAVAEFDTKLSGISDGANKVEASQTNGNIKIDGTETKVYDDSEIKTELSTATTEIEGNPVSFSTLTAQNATECSIDLEPIQDLHGYDKPWVGGAGKNKLPMVLDDIKSANTNGTWSGNAYTYNNVTFTVKTDSDDNVTGISLSGTASANAPFTFFYSYSFPAGSYILSSGRTKNFGYIQIISSSYRSYSEEAEVILSEATTGNAFIRVDSGTDTTGLSFYPMLRLSTESDATFAPYTNKASISGRTEANLGGCGKNLLELENGGYTNTATKATDTKRVRSNRILYLKAGTYNVSATSNQGKTLQYVRQYWKSNQYDTNKRIYDSGWKSMESFTLTTNQYVTFIFQTNDSSDLTIDDLTAQVELSLQPTAYSPYTESNDINIAFGETIYGCHIDVKRGVLRVDKAIKDLGDLTWANIASSNNFKAFISTKRLAPVDEDSILWCSQYHKIHIAYNNPSDAQNGDIWERAEERSVVIKDDRYTDATDFKSAMSGVQLVYELATPTEIPLTPHAVNLLKGANYISTDGDKITIEYRTGEVATLGDLKKAVDDMSAKMHVYSTEEQVVGKWSDGKPLYEKTFEFTLLASGGYRQYDTNLTGIAFAKIDYSASFYFLSASSTVGIIPYKNNTADDKEVVAFANFANNGLKIDYRVGADAAGKSAVVTLQYTKT